MTDTSNYMPQGYQPPTANLTQGIMQMLGASQPQPPGLAQQILSGRFNQPDMGDVGQSAYLTTQSALNPNVYRPMSPEQVRGQNEQALLDPYTKMLEAQKLELGNQYIAPLAQSQLTREYLANNVANQTALPLAQQDLQQKILANQIQQQTGLPLAEANLKAAQVTAQYAPQMAQSEIGLRGAQSGLAGAQAGYYEDALQRDLAEKQFDYQNNPANMQARMMGNYMASLTGQQPQSQISQSVGVPSGSGMSPVPASMPNAPASGGSPQQMNSIPQQMQQNAQPQSGFNPMGAVLAKQLGLTDMQIGPNGQPMPIPGSMKFENGQVVTFDQNGQPKMSIPINDKARANTESIFGQLSDKLDQLKAAGGAVSETQGWTQNQMNRALSSPEAQNFQAGSKAQTIRSEMTSLVMQALPDYMQAKGITPGMERSLGGQELILEAIGINPGTSVEASKAILANLSKVAGTGAYAQKYGSNSSGTSGGATHIYDPSSGQLVPAQ